MKTLPSQQTRKPVLVTFVRDEARNAIIGLKKSTLLDTEKCGIAADANRRIFINQDLSKHTRELFRKATELRKAGFKYVWCKDDNILVRRAENGPVIRIITSAQVDSLNTKGLLSFLSIYLGCYIRYSSKILKCH